MNIKISDNWLREYIDTPATVSEMAKALSLCSAGVERTDKVGSDSVYDIEVTTNRPDLMSVIGIAREASAVLPQFGIEATFKPLKVYHLSPKKNSGDYPIEIKNDPKLVNRILAVVLEVELKKSPEHIQNKLEKSDIRSLNNVIDVTNFVMREVGHPAHVFDYDRLQNKKLIIRAAKAGEQVTTLDKKTHTLPGGDIVADNGEGEIVDLLGIMGTENSVVTDNTKRILFFLDNNNPQIIRKTSMNLGVRTEAAVLNEKGVDPELMYEAFLRGIDLYQQIANAKLLSNVIDIYPNKPKKVTVKAHTDKIRSVIGTAIPDTEIKKILKKLGFEINQQDSMLTIQVPSYRIGDIAIEEDIIEEVARVYGYHNLPSELPASTDTKPYHLSSDSFYWERRVKTALKFWGFTETYTYSMVAEDMLEGPAENAVALKNPLDLDHVFMRQSLIPSLLEVVQQNDNTETIKIFELANIYQKKPKSLPDEIPYLAGVIRREGTSFYEAKGYIEAIFKDLGISTATYKASETTDGALVFVGKDEVGVIEILDKDLVNFELNFSLVLRHVSDLKRYSPIVKYPPMIEDITLTTPTDISYERLVKTIQNASALIREVKIIDIYEDKKTLRITYQHTKRNLTNEEVTEIRKKIESSLKKDLKAHID